MGIEPLVKATEPAVAVPGREWQQLWFNLLQHRWSSLAIVPAQPSVSVLPAARALVAVGRVYHQGPVHLIEAEGADPAATGFVISSAKNRVAAGEQVIIAVDSPLSKPVAIPITRAADAALLLIPLGRTRLAWARQTLDCVGREYFIGSITLGDQR
jgi:hypothetical protein